MNDVTLDYIKDLSNDGKLDEYNLLISKRKIDVDYIRQLRLNGKSRIANILLEKYHNEKEQAKNILKKKFHSEDSKRWYHQNKKGKKNDNL